LKIMPFILVVMLYSWNVTQHHWRIWSWIIQHCKGIVNLPHILAKYACFVTLTSTVGINVWIWPGYLSEQEDGDTDEQL
jgi:hypothetical protein